MKITRFDAGTSKDEYGYPIEDNVFFEKYPNPHGERYLENIEKDDIIYRKRQIKEMFERDPDLLEQLGEIELRKHELGETEEEAQDIEDYNSRIKQPEIIPWLKINPTITDVQNMILYDIYTERLNYDNPNFLRQYLVCMVMIREESMIGMNGNSRADIVAYIIKDLLNQTDALGMQLKLYLDQPKVVDGGFYCRELRFMINQPNRIAGQLSNGNKYDNWH